MLNWILFQSLKKFLGEKKKKKPSVKSICSFLKDTFFHHKIILLMVLPLPLQICELKTQKKNVHQCPYSKQLYTPLRYKKKPSILNLFNSRILQR